jgi:hypothetical protein
VLAEGLADARRMQIHLFGLHSKPVVASSTKHLMQTSMIQLSQQNQTWRNMLKWRSDRVSPCDDSTTTMVQWLNISSVNQEAVGLMTMEAEQLQQFASSLHDGGALDLQTTRQMLWTNKTGKNQLREPTKD